MDTVMTGEIILPRNIAAVVVLYNPDDSVAQRLLRYSTFLGEVFVIDNTECPLFAEAMAAVVGIHLECIGSNDGIARALNRGITLAAQHQYRWVVLLDQDSELTESTLAATLKGTGLDVGIVAPRQLTKERDARRSRSEYGFKQVLTTMTSGSVLNIAAFMECGPFEEKMFIDHVDHEYCLRLKQNGYLVMECRDAVLDHALGEVNRVSLAGRRIEITTLKPFRLYFFFRNGLYVSFRYMFVSPQFFFSFARQCMLYVIKALLFEHDKRLRLRMMALGVFDWALGRYGRRYV